MEQVEANRRAAVEREREAEAKATQTEREAAAKFTQDQEPNQLSNSAISSEITSANLSDRRRANFIKASREESRSHRAEDKSAQTSVSRTSEVINTSTNLSEKEKHVVPPSTTFDRPSEDSGYFHEDELQNTKSSRTKSTPSATTNSSRTAAEDEDSGSANSQKETQPLVGHTYIDSKSNQGNGRQGRLCPFCTVV